MPTDKEIRLLAEAILKRLRWQSERMELKEQKRIERFKKAAIRRAIKSDRIRRADDH